MLSLLFWIRLLLLLLLNLGVTPCLHPVLLPCPCFVIELLLYACVLRCASDGALLDP